MTRIQRRRLQARDAMIGRWLIVCVQAGVLALAGYGALCLMLVM